MTDVVIPSKSDTFRAQWFAAPILALLYPLVLDASHYEIQSWSANPNPAAVIGAIGLLLLAVAIPIVALILAIRLSATARPTSADLWAKRAAILAVAAPPLFTLPSVLFRLMGAALPDLWFYSAIWIGLLLTLVFADRATHVNSPLSPTGNRLRFGHGVVAALVVTAFLLPHLGNHLLGLVGADTHKAAMKVLRHFYQASLIEPLLLGGFVVLAGSGITMAWRYSARPLDGFRTFQVTSGVFLLFYLASHVSAVVPLARGVLHIDPNWDFATGAPTGLIRDAWSIRLVPYYVLAVFFALAHLLAGARVVMLAHGMPRRFADAFLLWGGVLAALIAITIMLGMCGMRVYFS